MKSRPKFCEQCGRELPLEGKFCPGCGDPIEASPTLTVGEKSAFDVPPPYPGGNAVNVPPPTPPPISNQPVSPQPATKPPFGVAPGYKSVTPSPIPSPTPSIFVGTRPVREKRMGGGIPTILGGLAFIGYPVYAVINKATPSYLVPLVGLVALVLGVFMLKVRSWKTFILAFLGSMLLAAYGGYSFYLLIQKFPSVEEGTSILSQPELLFVLAGSMLVFFGFSRAFNSLFRR